MLQWPLMFLADFYFSLGGAKVLTLLQLSTMNWRSHSYSSCAIGYNVNKHALNSHPTHFLLFFLHCSCWERWWATVELPSGQGLISQQNDHNIPLKKYCTHSNCVWKLRFLCSSDSNPWKREIKQLMPLQQHYCYAGSSFAERSTENLLEWFHFPYCNGEAMWNVGMLVYVWGPLKLFQHNVERIPWNGIRQPSYMPCYFSWHLNKLF